MSLAGGVRLLADELVVRVGGTERLGDKLLDSLVGLGDKLRRVGAECQGRKRRERADQRPTSTEFFFSSTPVAFLKRDSEPALMRAPACLAMSMAVSRRAGRSRGAEEGMVK